MNTAGKALLPFLILLAFVLSFPTPGSSGQPPAASVVTDANTTDKASATTSISGADNRYCLPKNVPNFGPPDGPATLPTACFYTKLSATPSNGYTWPVTTPSNLQDTINHAKCGDIIPLQAGVSYLSSSGGFVL